MINPRRRFVRWALVAISGLIGVFLALALVDYLGRAFFGVHLAPQRAAPEAERGR